MKNVDVVFEELWYSLKETFQVYLYVYNVLKDGCTQ
jgi:hypothetical protein